MFGFNCACRGIQMKFLEHASLRMVVLWQPTHLIVWFEFGLLTVEDSVQCSWGTLVSQQANSAPMGNVIHLLPEMGMV